MALKINKQDPWWVIVLKAIAYVIGLILGGIGTTSCAHILGVFTL